MASRSAASQCAMKLGVALALTAWSSSAVRCAWSAAATWSVMKAGQSAAIRSRCAASGTSPWRVAANMEGKIGGDGRLRIDERGLGGLCFRESAKEIGSPRRLRCGDSDRSGILAQDRQPRAQVLSVIGPERLSDAELDREETSANLRDKLFERISFVAK